MCWERTFIRLETTINIGQMVPTTVIICRKGKGKETETEEKTSTYRGRKKRKGS
jgi:hypothetical protein